MRELEEAIGKIWEIADRMGLDPYPVHFELVPATIMYEFGAYGLPGRFSHWTHGRAYQQIKTMYDYGLSKIYELVINTNPAYAFLLENNTGSSEQACSSARPGARRFLQEQRLLRALEPLDARDGQHQR